MYICYGDSEVLSIYKSHRDLPEKREGRASGRAVMLLYTSTHAEQAQKEKEPRWRRCCGAIYRKEYMAGAV